MQEFEINLFGGLSTSTAGSDPEKLDLSPSGAALFGLLALGVGKRTLRREQLTETLWPDCAPAKQRARLRTALWRLRKGLPGWAQGMIRQVGDASEMHLPEGARLVHTGFETTVIRMCSTDVAQMTDADFTALDACLRRYGGPLLDGVNGDWVLAEREKFAEIYCQGLAHQIHYLRVQGRDHETIRAGRKLLEVDPYREDVHATLIEIYARAGRPERAQRQYQTCQQLFEDDLGISPMLAQVTLHAARGAGPCAGVGEDVVQMVQALHVNLEAMAAQVRRIQEALGQGPVARVRRGTRPASPPAKRPASFAV
jgi:DNA-binding SARP family transcriptional activator